MSEHEKGLSKIKREICYESAWLSRWTHRSSRDAKCSKEINLPGDGQLLKESTKLKGKMLSQALDLFPNPDSAVQIIPDMNKEPPIVAEREDSIDEDKGETSRSATQSKNVELYLNNYTNTNLCKRIRLDPETKSGSEVKRLKTNASDYSGDETKSMMVAEGPSVEKVNYYFNKIFGINKPGSMSNQNSSTSQIKKNLNMGRGGGEEDVNPWIQRWCKKKIAETHETRGGQEVNPKATALENKFPSVAAMALMGRALRGLNPTGCRKTNTQFVRDAQYLR